MYQNFGAREVEDSRRVRFRLFIPDNTLDPAQYQSGTLPGLAKVHAIGDFQASLGGPNWTPDPKFELTKRKLTDPEDGSWTDLLSGWQPRVQNNRLRFDVGSSWGHIFHKKY